MGLDKWLNSDEDVKEESKKSSGIKKRKIEGQQGPNQKKEMSKLEKYSLICPNSKCKYQKIVMKKKITDKDKICPRCNKEMKVKRS